MPIVLPSSISSASLGRWRQQQPAAVCRRVCVTRLFSGKCQLKRKCFEWRLGLILKTVRTRLQKILDVLRLKSPELEPQGPRVSCQEFRPLHAAHKLNSAALHLARATTHFCCSRAYGCPDHPCWYGGSTPSRQSLELGCGLLL